MRSLIKQVCSKFIVPLSILSLSLGVLTYQNAYANTSQSTHQLHAAKSTKPIQFQKIAPKGPKLTAKQKQTKAVWNFHDADIKAVITNMAILTGQTFLIDPNINGRVSIVSKKPMTVLVSSILIDVRNTELSAVKQFSDAHCAVERCQTICT